MPRAALLGLHARLEGADPGSWEDQALAQTYGPRGAVYIFPRDAVPAFTRGLLPRDDADREQIESVAARVADALTNGPLRQKELAAVAPEFDGLGFHAVRLAARAGRYLIRWDTSSLHIVLNETPPDPSRDEEARIDLAQRFLRWHGPADAAAFAKWSGVNRQDAETTWASVTSLVEEIEEAASRTTGFPEGVRLLPHNDAYLFHTRELVVPDARRRKIIYPSHGQPGVVLVDGRIQGIWQRTGRQFRLELWAADPEMRRRIQEGAETASVPLGGDVDIDIAITV